MISPIIMFILIELIISISLYAVIGTERIVFKSFLIELIIPYLLYSSFRVLFIIHPFLSAECSSLNRLNT